LKLDRQKSKLGKIESVLERTSPREPKKKGSLKNSKPSTGVKPIIEDKEANDDGFVVDPLREALGLELFSKFKSFMTLTIPDPLSWNCPVSSAEDWDNVPEMAVQIILYLEKHGKALTDYVKLVSRNESTHELRKSLEDKLKVSLDFKVIIVKGNECQSTKLHGEHGNSTLEI